jgi:putative ABC transport system ATP-binding protein
MEDVRYKGILDINNLIISDHRITCIVGESGSGKTTVLRLLNKMISPDSGRIFYKGDPIDELDTVEHRRKVVMLSQEPVIFPGTIRDNLLLGLDFSDKPAVGDGKLADCLAMVNLDKPLDEDTARLSGGEKQRLALGRVILLDPEVFLLDEPSSSLDADTEAQIVKALAEYANRHDRSMVMVTHSLAMARNFADEIIHIGKGMILEKEEKRI